MHVNNIHIEKTVSRIFVLSPAWLTLLTKKKTHRSQSYAFRQLERTLYINTLWYAHCKPMHIQ